VDNSISVLSTPELILDLVDDGLSYCTWNGLGQGLTEEKIFTALDSLSKNEINISNLIIDDNWQSLVGSPSLFGDYCL
jgi:hypothetical protein